MLGHRLGRNYGDVLLACFISQKSILLFFRSGVVDKIMKGLDKSQDMLGYVGMLEQSRKSSNYFQAW